ncbi:MAG: hypothetical protein AMXMBFR84_05120 [Candidatus Hydrogenedentota bacterium]
MPSLDAYIQLFLQNPLGSIGAILFSPILLLLYGAAILITPFYQALIP